MRNLTKFNVQMEEATLGNGARVILFKRKGMPIYLRATFFAGSRFDKTTGTAHFLEHMLLAGTEKFPSKNLLAGYIQNIGGDFSAATGSDLLRINVEIPLATDLSVGVDVLNECITHSLFDLKTIETERGSIFSEIKNIQSHPSQYIRNVFNKLAFQSTDLEKSITGSLQDVEQITKDDLLSFKMENLNAGRVCFVVAGDVAIEDLVGHLNIIKLPESRKLDVKDKLPIIQEKRLEIEHYPEVNQLQVWMGCRTSIENYKEYCSLRVLNMILALGRGSRLATKLRYQKGLIYSVFGNVIESGDWGIFRITLSCGKDNWSEVENSIYGIFEDIMKHGVTESELNTVKARISKGMVRNLQTSEDWVNTHETEAFFQDGAFHTVEDFIDGVSSLTPEDIRSTANKYLKKETFYTAICGNYK